MANIISSKEDEESEGNEINANLTTVLEQIRVQLESKDVQTENKQVKNSEVQTIGKNEVRNLSPFETYDLLFIRDLVNNLNYDNEVLHDNSEDLKAAFMFLLN